MCFSLEHNILTFHLATNLAFCLVFYLIYIYIYTYCYFLSGILSDVCSDSLCGMLNRASQTGDAIRVMYSSVSVGVVHVLCACAQVQSTVRCSSHTAACNHLTTHLFVTFLCVFLFFLFLLLLLLLLQPSLIRTFEKPKTTVFTMCFASGSKK